MTEKEMLEAAENILRQDGTTLRGEKGERMTYDRFMLSRNPYTGRESWKRDRFIRQQNFGEETVEDINEFLTFDSRTYNRELMERYSLTAVTEHVYPAGRTPGESLRLATKGNEIVRIAYCHDEEMDGETAEAMAGKMADILISAETGRRRVLTKKGAEMVALRAVNPKRTAQIEELRKALDTEKENTTNTNGETHIINNQNSTKMAEQESAAKTANETQEASQRKGYGSVYASYEYPNKNGEMVKLPRPYFQVTIDIPKIAELEPDKAGNIKLSIHERREAKKLAEEKKPTCFLVENTYSKDKQIDAFSKCDIQIKKEDVMKLAKKTDYGEKAFITINTSGEISPMKGMYEGEPTQIEGKAFHVDSIERQIRKNTEGMEQKQEITAPVGHAWKIKGEKGDFYSMAINSDLIKALPIDDEKKVHLSLHELKEVKGENGPTHIVVPEYGFHTGKIDTHAVLNIKILKSNLLDQKVALKEKINVDDKEYNRSVCYVKVSSENRVSLNYKRYPELCQQQADGTILHTFALFGATAETVDQEAARKELESRIQKSAANKAKAEQTAKPEQKKPQQRRYSHQGI